jgi:hypothetical protein
MVVFAGGIGNGWETPDFQMLNGAIVICHAG